jgi:hypothetical protein
MSLYVYRDDLGAEWAVSIPSSVGDHREFGFEPVNNRKLPTLKLRYRYVGPVRPRCAGSRTRPGRTDRIRRNRV